MAKKLFAKLFLMAILLSTGGVLRAESFICAKPDPADDKCPVTHVNPATGAVTIARLPEGCIVDTDAGYIVNKKNGWRFYPPPE